MALLNEHDMDIIHHAVERAEEKSASEIVIVAVGSCDDYGPYRAAWSAVAATALCGLTAIFAPHYPDPWYVIAVLPAGFLFWVLSGIPWMMRCIVPKDIREAAMNARLMQAFSEHRVYATRDKTGLLIILCEAEHLVGILGDSGIHAHVGNDGWKAHVNTIVQGIRNKQPAKALAQVIDELAEVLVHIAPRREDDANELPNNVRVER